MEFPAHDVSSSASSLLAAIVQSSEDAIISKDLQGTITSWNKAAERIFGYTAEEMINSSIIRLIPEELADEELRILYRLNQGERIDHFESVRIRKDGTRIDVSLCISPVRNEAGTVIGASKIARDITQQKKMREDLETALEALKRSDRLKTEFVTTVSHELRTPLNAIFGWLEILHHNDTGENSELREALEAIERNAQAQARLVDDLLDMSRIETGKIKLDLQSLDVPTIVTTAIDAIKPTVVAKNIKLTSAFDSISGTVFGDKSRLQQVLWNLLTNAVKFTPKGGRIHVTIERANSHLDISVSDNGVGIAPHILPVVFDRFRQGNHPSNQRYGGLGLGLTIAKHLVELHGGQIRAKSSGEGRGATFVVSLPVVAVHDPEKVEASVLRAHLDENAEQIDLIGLRILVVDDEGDSLRVMKRILEIYHAEVEVADNVEDALLAFEKSKPHLVLSDLGMPGRDGYDLVASIRRIAGGKAVPIIAVSALTRAEDRTRAIRAGFQMHLGKPLDPQELVAAVKSLGSLVAHQGNSW